MIASILLVRFGNGEQIRTSLFDLLPRSDYDPRVETAVSSIRQEMARRFIVVIGHGDQATAAAAGSLLAEKLLGHPLVETLDSVIDEERIDQIARFFYPHRRRLVTRSQIASIDADDGEEIVEEALASLYSPFGTANAQSLTSDPFYLFPESLNRLRGAGNGLVARDGFLWTEHESVHYLLLSARARPSVLSSAEQSVLVEDLNAMIGDLRESLPDIEVLTTGYPIFAHAGTQSAKSEITLIGAGSLIGIVLLILTVFRSIRPLGLAILSIAVGCIVAMTAVVLVFGSVHIFTLIFGASLIGVSIDYTFHLVSELSFTHRTRSVTECLRTIFPGVTLGLVSSTIAYLTLLAAPFPGLRQLALFSAMGLSGAYLTLMIFAGEWARPSPLTDRAPLLLLCRWYLDLWAKVRPQTALAGVLVLTGLALLSVPRLRVDDSVSQLQSRPDDLVAQEDAIEVILGNPTDTAFALITASDAESVLQSEEAASHTLDELIERKMLSGYQALSRYVPSQARQRDSERAYDRLLETRLEPYFSRIGLESVSSDDVAAAIRQEAVGVLSLDRFLDSSIGRDLAFLWVGTADGSSSSMIHLQGISDLAAVSRAFDDDAGVTVVDQQADLSELFAAYRIRVSALLGVAYLAVFVLLSRRYTPGGALVVLIPPVTAGLLALSVFSLAGLSINLFNVLAVILVLGIGVDFTLFNMEARKKSPRTMFAISLSAATTLLSFGLLSLSTTFAVQAFGLTILLGIAFAFLLAPLASLGRP